MLKCPDQRGYGRREHKDLFANRSEKNRALQCKRAREGSEVGKQVAGKITGKDVDTDGGAAAAKDGVKREHRGVEGGYITALRIGVSKHAVIKANKA